MIRLLVLGWLCGLSASAWAQTRSQVYGSELDRQTMTAFLRADMGWNTYDSKTVESKETRSSTTFMAGAFAGERRNVGMVFSSNENNVPYSLNDSRVNAAFRDVKLKARFGWVYPTIAASLTEMRVERSGATLANLYSSGVGAGAGVELPLHDRIVVYGEGMMFRPSVVKDRTDNNVDLGQRNEFDVGASVDLTDKILDLMVGYRVRSYSLSLNGTEQDELTSGAYAGLRLGLYF